MNPRQYRLMKNLEDILYINSQFVRKSQAIVEYFESTGRLSTIWEYDNFILSISLDKKCNLTLHRIKIPEYHQEKRSGHNMLKSIRDVLRCYDPNLKFIIKYSENKSFWKHYKEKYNPNLVFQYQ